MKIDAQLCIVIKSTIHSSLKHFFRTYETCSEVWEQAKLLYTNDTQRLYGVCQNLLTIVAPKHLDSTMAEFLGKLHALLHDFNELLPPATTASQVLEQRSKFFMLLGLHGLSDDYSHVRDRILGSPIVPNFTSICSTLLRVLGKHTTDITSHVDDSSALVSQHNDRTCPHKSGKGRHKCDHCGKLGHKIDRCYALYGRPPKSVAVAQTAPVQLSTMDHTSIDTPGQPPIFNEFLKWYEDRQNPSSTASVAHSGTSFVGLTHSTSLGPWVLDSGTSSTLLVINLFSFSYLLRVIYLLLPWPMDIGYHHMVLILLIFFLLYLLIMFFVSLGLHLTYYPLVISLVPLIVLFLLPKILLLYRIGVWDR